MTWLERAALQLFQRTQKATNHQQHLQRKYGTTDPKVIKARRKLSNSGIPWLVTEKDLPDK